MGGGMMGGMGGGGMGGGGMFSIPPEKVVSVPFRGVCLQHGRPLPRASMKYLLVKVEDFTKDAALQELLKMFAKRRINQQAAQAAAWNLTDKMSWRQLAAKKVKRLGELYPRPYFTFAELFKAQQLVASARSYAKQREGKEPAPDQPRPRTVARIRSTR